MKKRTKILLALVILLLLILALICWQFNNIKMVYYSYKYDNLQIEELLREHNETINKYIDDQDYKVRPPTKLEQDLHKNNLLTEDELVQILIGKTSVEQIFGQEIRLDEKNGFIDENNRPVTPETLKEEKEATPPADSPPSASASKSPPSTKPTPETTATPSPSPEPTGSDSNAKASDCIARMYVLKSSFESKLDQLYQEAVSYYSQLDEEQRKNAKSEMLSRFYSRAVSMERQCDSQVESILSDLTNSLNESGGDTSIVSKMRQAYQNEKSLKKSYYLNLVK